MFYVTSSVLFLFALCAVQAFRDQYLVVLRWPVGYFYLERGADGRYAVFHPARLPVVIVRFGVLSVVSALHLTRRRVRGWAEASTSSTVRSATAR